LPRASNQFFETHPYCAGGVNEAIASTPEDRFRAAAVSPEEGQRNAGAQEDEETGFQAIENGAKRQRRSRSRWAFVSLNIFQMLFDVAQRPLT
jgi:hypothetical protein